MHSQQDFYKNQFIFISIKFLIIAHCKIKKKNEKKDEEEEEKKIAHRPQNKNQIPFHSLIYNFCTNFQCYVEQYREIIKRVGQFTGPIQALIFQFSYRYPVATAATAATAIRSNNSSNENYDNDSKIDSKEFFTNSKQS